MNKSINNIITLNKNKVVFIMGATGMGKSHLSVDLATHFSTEIINFDKMQVYKGLDIVTNKITDSEKEGVPHYLLEKKCILLFRYCGVGYVSIVVGGSNSYIEKLVEDPTFAFKSNYDSCFIWIDIDVSTLDPFLRKRIDYMVQTGLVDEVREIFSPEEDYNKGIRRSIGVPEMDRYFREENKFDTCEESTKKILLESAIEEIKFADSHGRYYGHGLWIYYMMATTSNLKAFMYLSTSEPGISKNVVQDGVVARARPRLVMVTLSNLKAFI
ncbi:hypothetical protein P3S68_001339 [Capsicum galapagoense]